MKSYMYVRAAYTRMYMHMYTNKTYVRKYVCKREDIVYFQNTIHRIRLCDQLPTKYTYVQIHTHTRMYVDFMGALRSSYFIAFLAHINCSWPRFWILHTNSFLCATHGVLGRYVSSVYIHIHKQTYSYMYLHKFLYKLCFPNVRVCIYSYVYTYVNIQFKSMLNLLENSE